MRAVHRLIERYGRTTAPVTIHGESGTGKELVARALHQASPRRDGPFVAFNCSAVTDTLLESELFGALKGSYTGADRDRQGLFELAHGGTLFMDEVGDMSLDMQAKLLRVLETGELRPVGGRALVKVDVRIISASHFDLRALSQQGKMREDLFYRLNVLRIELPPLRERREDLPRLAEHFLERVSRERGEPRRRLSPEALEVLLRHPFPGNVRELRNVLERACVLEPDEVIGASRLLVDAPPAAPTPAQARLPAYQRTYAFQGVALNRRQRQVLEHLSGAGGGAVAVTNREFCAMVGVSERTGLRDLAELVDQGILVRLGKRKGARYQLARRDGDLRP
ncbi:MAG: sigma-54-dependent Fis family transcriptional regulator [Planctomycetes bacterium]|nr:sigma-54-dependent Fis family transcriptional regulator [Planctomycetota bacterium]